MRKLLLALLLPVAMLLSQQGAVTHELGHLAGAVARAANGQGASGKQLSDLQCEACLAFAHLAGVATVQVAPPVLRSLRLALPAEDAPAFIAADAPAARSRGPPRVL